MPNRYSLSDAEMLDIKERMRKANSPDGVALHALTATWDAVLRQEGSSFVQAISHDGFKVTDYSIPEDQANEIGELLTQLIRERGADALTTTNRVVDWNNYRPGIY